MAVTRDERNRRVRESYAWYREHGICPRCKTRDAAIGWKRCAECQYKMYVYASAPERYEKYRQTELNRYARRRAEGICVTCGKQPAAPGHASCEPCLAKKRYQQRRAYRLKIRPTELCMRCDQPAVKGYKLCPAHLKQMRAIAPLGGQAEAKRRKAEAEC